MRPDGFDTTISDCVDGNWQGLEGDIAIEGPGSKLASNRQANFICNGKQKIILGENCWKQRQKTDEALYLKQAPVFVPIACN